MTHFPPEWVWGSLLDPKVDPKQVTLIRGSRCHLDTSLPIQFQSELIVSANMLVRPLKWYPLLGPNWNHFRDCQRVASWTRVPLA